MGDFAAGFFSGAGDKFGDSLEERVRVNQQAQQFHDTMTMDQKRFGEEQKNSEVNRKLTQAQIEALIYNLSNSKLDDPIKREILGAELQGRRTGNVIAGAAVPYAQRSAEADVLGKEEAVQTSKAQRRQFKSADEARRFQNDLDKQKFDFAKMQAVLSNSRDDKQLALSERLAAFNEAKFEFDKELAGQARTDRLNEFASQMDANISQTFMQQAGPLANQAMAQLSAGEISPEEFGAEMLRITGETKNLINMSRPGRKGGAPSFSPDLTGGDEAPAPKPQIDLTRFNKRSAVEATGKQNARPADVASDPRSQEFYWNANPGQLYVIHPGTNQAVKLNVFAETFQDAMQTLRAATADMPTTACAQDMQEAINKHQAAYNKQKDYLRGRTPGFNIK